MGESRTTLIMPALEERFRSAWDSCRVLLFSAPCGFGKTVTAAALLRGRSACALDAASADFSPGSIPARCRTVLVDDLQLLREPERQQALCALIRARGDLHFVLLGRTRKPGWLIPFDLSGMMCTFTAEDLFFDQETTRRMLESRGAEVNPAELTAVFRDLKGYPLGLELLSRQLLRGRRYGPAELTAAKRELFAYYDEAILYAVDGERLFYTLSTYESKPANETPEAHKKYIDVQFLISGRELVGVAPLSAVEKEVRADPEGDIWFYQGAVNRLLLTEKRFLVLFPQDAHAPCIAAGRPARCRKCVVKVMVCDNPAGR